VRRREFIKISGALGLGPALGATLGPALLSGCSGLPADGPVRGDPDAQVTITPTVCNICFWGCAGFVHAMDGQPWKVVGNEADLHSRGRLCTRGTGGIGAYLDRDRLRQPLLRVKGSGGQSFKPVSWDEALGYSVSLI
jgi:thiosulfate reductase/polysulfide reductase chain A